MTQLAHLAHRQADSFSARLDRWHDVAARQLEEHPWLLGVAFVLAVAYQVALLARTLNLTE
jgi:hypothetical protein